MNLYFPPSRTQFVHAVQTESFLRGKNPFDAAVLDSAFQILMQELQPDSNLLDASPEYRKQLALGIFYKGILRLAAGCGVNLDARVQSGATLLQRPLSTGQQSFESYEKVRNAFWRETHTAAAGLVILMLICPHVYHCHPIH